MVISALVWVVTSRFIDAATPKAALDEAIAAASKLTFRIDRSIAYLTIAQAENKLGDKASSIHFLDMGWQAYKTGSDKGMPLGDRTDAQFLFNEGDLATLPEPYAIEYLVAGNKQKALDVASSFGDTPLGRSFRHNIGDRIRRRFPDDYYELAYSDAQRKEMAAKKQGYLDQVAKVKEEPDVSKRAYFLWEIANQISIYDGRKESIDIIHDAVALAPKIEPATSRVVFMAQVADTLWLDGAKDEAKALIEQAMKDDAKLDGDPKQVLQAHMFVEQAKRSMGMPNDLDKILKEMDQANGVVPPPANNEINPEDSSDPYAFLERARKLQTAGDIEAAKKVLRTATISPDIDGAWHTIAAEMQIQLGDKEPAKSNLLDASRRLVATLRPILGPPGENVLLMEKIARLQVEAGDRANASKTIVAGIRKLADGPTTTKIQHMGDGGNQMVSHDRKSPILHKGAMMLAAVGDFPSAMAMAQSIPGAAHRAIALAGIVRDYNVQP